MAGALCFPSLQVAVLLGTVVMCVSTGVLLLSRNYVGKLFSSEHSVVLLTAEAVPPLAISLIGKHTPGWTAGGGGASKGECELGQV